MFSAANNHGSFMFFRDDGSTMLYCVDPSESIDARGEASILVDAFKFRPLSLSGMQTHFISYENSIWEGGKFPTVIQMEQSKKAIENVYGNSFKHDFLHALGDGRALIHEALESGCDAETIKWRLGLNVDEDGEGNELSNLDHRDVFGCTPLHYACRCQPQDLELIRILIEQCPSAVTIRDNFDRCPLHIACDNSAPLELVDELIEHDPTRESVYQTTKYLERLPIHIALQAKLSKDVIECLLKADPFCKTLNFKSKSGRIPLHTAVEQRLGTDVIRLLLETNAKDHYENEHYSSSAIEITRIQISATKWETSHS